MKQFIVVLFFAMLLSSKMYGQCSIDELFPIKHGMTKSQVVKVLNDQENIQDVKELDNKWDHPEYLKGDSVLLSQVNFKFKTHDCLDSNNNEVILLFADDVLYDITLRAWFDSNSFEKCHNNYRSLFASLNKSLPCYEEVSISRKYGGEAEKVKIGEGFRLYRSEQDMKNKPLEYPVVLEYSTDYKCVTNLFSGERCRTGKINKYMLHLGYSNLKGTKHEGRGFH
ncbi:hypothetical protein EYV94_25950 [Puteibacter caeruleilacunae]|nr:hypothetical protein EYV94_25950 [Puteibacter caeruleilacunae]